MILTIFETNNGNPLCPRFFRQTKESRNPLCPFSARHSIPIYGLPISLLRKGILEEINKKINTKHRKNCETVLTPGISSKPGI